MNNDELKNIWQKIDFNKSEDFELTEDNIVEMLEGRTYDIFSRISKNVKIGFWILGAYIVIIALSYYHAYFTTDSVMNDISGKYFLALLDVLIDGFIVVTFIYFVVKYNRIDKAAISHSNLKSTISEVIKILSTYKKLFYYGFTIGALGFVFGFIVGVQKGIEIAAEEYGAARAAEFPEIRIYVITFLIGLALIGGILFTVHFFFKKLYGKYLIQLQECQTELIEAE